MRYASLGRRASVAEGCSSAGSVVGVCGEAEQLVEELRPARGMRVKVLFG